MENALPVSYCWMVGDPEVADLIETGQPQPVEHLARASKTHSRRSIAF
jgi:hypothetical protein